MWWYIIMRFLVDFKGWNGTKKIISFFSILYWFFITLCNFYFLLTISIFLIHINLILHFLWHIQRIYYVRVIIFKRIEWIGSLNIDIIIKVRLILIAKNRLFNFQRLQARCLEWQSSVFVLFWYWLSFFYLPTFIWAN